MNEIAVKKLNKLKHNITALAPFLTIKTKNDALQPLKLTNIQLDAYNKIEERRKSNKLLKIVFLKARQVGLSTLTEAIYFQKVLFNRGKNAFVLADKTDSANNIYSMARRFYDNLPEALKIELKNNSTKELSFKTDSSFRVGTAGGNSVGRSLTINYFHGSEVAFWDKADELVASMFPTIPDSPESMVILESTANGTTGKGRFFYELVQSGIEKNSEYLTIFYPWYEHKEYRRTIIEPIKWTDEEIELKRIYNLTDEQLAWRRAKIESDYKKREYLFAQEYPICIQDAFVTTSNALIPLNIIELSKKNYMSSAGMPIIIGVDPARSGDRTIITIRQGRVILKFYKFTSMNNVKLAGIIERIIQALNPAKVFIDYGHGTGCYDILVNDGYSSVVELIQFGESAQNSRKYANRRAEMFDRLRDWYLQVGGVFIKDQEYIEEFVRDISILPDLDRSDSSGKFIMEKKENIVKGTDIHSTDFADSLALTFANKVQRKETNQIVEVVNKHWNER